MKKTTILTILLALAFSGGCKIQDPEDNNGVGTLTGLVTAITVDGYAAPNQGGATVQVLGTSFRTISDTAGNWTMNNIPAGIYNVLVTKPGYDTVIWPIQFSGSGTQFLEGLYPEQIPQDTVTFTSVSINPGTYDTSTVTISVQVVDSSVHPWTYHDSTYTTKRIVPVNAELVVDGTISGPDSAGFELEFDTVPNRPFDGFGGQFYRQGYQLGAYTIERYYRYPNGNYLLYPNIFASDGHHFHFTQDLESVEQQAEIPIAHGTKLYVRATPVASDNFWLSPDNTQNEYPQWSYPVGRNPQYPWAWSWNTAVQSVIVP